MDGKGKNLGEGSVGKLLFGLAVPTVTAQMVNMLYNIVDRMYIGHIPEVGAAALTGVGITFPIVMLISAFSALVGMGGAPRASIQMGRGDREGAEKILGNCFILLLAVSVVLTVSFLIFQEKLLRLFGASANTLPYARDYLAIYVCGTVFVQMSLGMNAFITAQGFTKVSMMTVMIGAAINIVLDPVFIFVFGMGVRGAAIATVLSQAVSCVWVLRFLTGPKTGLRIRRSNFGLSRRIVVPVLALGISPFIMQSTECLMQVAYNTSLQKYGGDIAVGAMTILISMMQFLNQPLSGLSQGAQPIIGFNYGAGNPERVKQAFRLLLLFSMLYAFLFWGAAMLFPSAFITLFSSDPKLMEMTVWALRIYFSLGFLMCFQFTCQNTFLALGQAKCSLFLALLRKIVLIIPLIYLLPNFFEDKVFAIFLTEPVSDTIAVLTTVTLFSFQFRKILRGIEKKP